MWTNSNWEAKALLLNSQGTVYPPCIQSLQVFEESLERFAAGRFGMATISVDQEGWGVVRPFVKEHRLSYPVLLQNKSTVGVFGNINQLPTTCLVQVGGTGSS